MKVSIPLLPVRKSRSGHSIESYELPMRPTDELRSTSNWLHKRKKDMHDTLRALIVRAKYTAALWSWRRPASLLFLPRQDWQNENASLFFIDVSYEIWIERNTKRVGWSVKVSIDLLTYLTLNFANVLSWLLPMIVWFCWFAREHKREWRGKRQCRITSISEGGKSRLNFRSIYSIYTFVSIDHKETIKSTAQMRETAFTNEGLI